jgi:DNA-binding MarR family transcriptional regulator
VSTRGIEDVRRPLAQLLRLGASRKVHARQAAVAGALVTAPGAALLAVLVEQGPLSLSDLARETDMDLGAASRQVKALDTAGLVARGGRDGDARVQVLEVTAAGRDVRRRIAAVQDRHMADVLEGWSPQERAQFARLLTRFVDDLRAVGYRPGGERTDLERRASA